MAMDSTRLGTAMFNAVNALAAGATEADAKARMIAMAQCFIDEISDNATIASLATDGGTTAGDPPHKHYPATNEATGKIS